MRIIGNGFLADLFYLVVTRPRLVLQVPLAKILYATPFPLPDVDPAMVLDGNPQIGH